MDRFNLIWSDGGFTNISEEHAHQKEVLLTGFNQPCTKLEKIAHEVVSVSRLSGEYTILYIWWTTLLIECNQFKLKAKWKLNRKMQSILLKWMDVVPIPQMNWHRLHKWGNISIRLEKVAFLKFIESDNWPNCQCTTCKSLIIVKSIVDQWNSWHTFSVAWDYIIVTNNVHKRTPIILISGQTKENGHKLLFMSYESDKIGYWSKKCSLHLIYMNHYADL